MDKETIELAAGRIQKARDKLRVAEKLLAQNEFEDAVSRAYYAVFHAAQALLIGEGYKAQSHSGVKTLFHLHFIKTKRMDAKFGRYLTNLKDDREEGDYETAASFDEEIASTALQEAREFVHEAAQALKPYINP